jgi:hypothetical protein
MALRPDRDYNLIDDISHFWVDDTNSVQNGGVASVVTAGSGVSLDDGKNVVKYVATPSGAAPMGALLQPVTYYAGSRVFMNFHNGEIRPGQKCTLVRKGWIVTNMVSGTPTAGAAAYLAENGKVSPTQMSFDDGKAPKVGRFETTKDADGFAKVYIDL